MRRLVLLLLLLLAPVAARAADPASCAAVRLSNPGWTDITANTGVASVLLSALGYRPTTTILSIPVIYSSMRNGDIDIFLGNWMPTTTADRAPYLADGSVVVAGPILEGAKYTLAVPAYTYQAGLRSFADIARFKDALDGNIYGIEPGNDGNRLILGMIHDDRFGLGGFQLVESSEQGMLAEVERATTAHHPIVFLGWQPHPMNTRFAIRYLSGGDAVFGPDYGGAVVFKNLRGGYDRACPNVARLIRAMKVSIPDENAMMADILDRRMTAEQAGRRWLRGHLPVWQAWLAGVTTLDGKPAAPAVTAALAEISSATWMTAYKIPLGDTVTDLIERVKAHKAGFAFVADGITAVTARLTAWLTAVPALLIVVATGIAAWLLQRSWPLAAFVVLGLLFIINQGYWAETIETLVLVLCATAVASVIGVPLGIAAGHRPRLAGVLRPVLDLMQTLPTFVYLIPTLVLFGLGVAPGLISTVIFALPAPVRLTQLGIQSVPTPLLEAGTSFGATRWQLLTKVELPAAAPMILVGITQCIMLSLSMVVIAALVGAGGLGVPVVRALNTVQVGMGFEAGFAIVILAIILDRVFRPRAKSGL